MADETNPPDVIADFKRRYCPGCEDNFYNGNNPYGIGGCWSLNSAKEVMRKMVHINDVPPWNHTPKETLSCFHKKQFVMIDEDGTC
jgi:hypothetical protein